MIYLFLLINSAKLSDFFFLIQCQNFVGCLVIDFAVIDYANK